MAILLLGSRELHARMDALKLCFQPAGRRWAEDTVKTARPRIKVATGKTRASLRVRSATKNKATVAVRYVQRFQEGDTKAHTITAKHGAIRFQSGGRTIFARKALRRVHRGTPVVAPAAQDALSRSPLREELVNAWNGGA